MPDYCTKSTCAGCYDWADCDNDARDDRPYTCARCDSSLAPNWVVAEDEYGQPICDMCN